MFRGLDNVPHVDASRATLEASSRPPDQVCAVLTVFIELVRL